MKRILAISFALILVLSLLASCTSGKMKDLAAKMDKDMDGNGKVTASGSTLKVTMYGDKIGIEDKEAATKALDDIGKGFSEIDASTEDGKEAKDAGVKKVEIIINDKEGGKKLDSKKFDVVFKD